MLKQLSWRLGLNVIFQGLFFVPIETTSAQNVDTTATYRIVNPEKQKFFTSYKHVTIARNKFQFSMVERQIIGLESEECNALLKRDTVTLKRIWARDYSLDEPANRLVLGKNPLPYYTVVNRIIENLSATDSVVFTSGVELVQIIQVERKDNDLIKRRFFHTWRRRNFAWKLTTKVHE